MFGRKKPQPETGGAPPVDDAPLLAQATPPRPTGFNPAASQMLPPASQPPAPPSPMAPPAQAPAQSTVAPAAASMSSSATQAQGSPMSSSESPSSSFRPEIPRRTDIPGLARSPATLPTAPGTGGAPKQESGPDPKTLIVGREISLTGQIAACDRLIIEGKVEVSLSDSRFIEISETGVFKGNADIEEAEIRGRFEGKLTVKGRLLIRGTGKVVGEIRYGQIEIECGGQISGSVETVDGLH